MVKNCFAIFTVQTYNTLQVLCMDRKLNDDCLLKRFPHPLIFRKYMVQTLKNTVNSSQKRILLNLST